MVSRALILVESRVLYNHKKETAMIRTPLRSFYFGPKHPTVSAAMSSKIRGQPRVLVIITTRLNKHILGTVLVFRLHVSTSFKPNKPSKKISRSRLLDSSNFDHGKRVNIILPLYEREEQVRSELHHGQVLCC